MSAIRRLVTLGAWIALLVLVLVGFTAVGSGPLAAPPVTDPGSWGAWASEREPVEVAFALLRLVVLALAWYLLGVSIVGVTVRLLRLTRLVSVTDVVTVPAVRSLLQAALGLGLATAAVTSLGAPGRHDQGVATAAVAQEAGGARLMMLQVNGDSFGSAVMRQGEPPSSLPWVVRAEPREPTTPVREWEVQTGEHFWSIAEQVLSEAWNRTPTNDEVAPYWRALVAHNQDTLADPDNPDLVFPGQVFHIPAPPAATSN